MSLLHIFLFLLDTLFSLNHVNLGLNLDLLNSLFCVVKKHYFLSCWYRYRINHITTDKITYFQKYTQSIYEMECSLLPFTPTTPALIPRE